jgi:ribose-phosphate pyrophosphokinase
LSGKLKVFSGNASLVLASKVCERLSLPLGEATVSRFRDGEVRVRFEENIRDADVFIVNSTHPPAENLLEMMLLGEAARGSSAERITFVCPYLGYNRQDRKDAPRVPISARLIARMLSISGADRMLIIDLHSEATMGFFDDDIRVDHLYGSAVSLPYLREMLKGSDFVVASPDKGGGPRAEAYANRLGLSDYVLFTKTREVPGKVRTESVKIIGSVRGKNVLFVDDMIDSGGTVIADAEAALEAGAKEIFVCATHPIFSGDAVERLDESHIAKVVTTDTIAHNPEKLATKRLEFTVLSVAPLLAEAIRKVHEGESLSSLIR